MYISAPPSPENLLPRRESNPGPAEPEADMLPSEPARRVTMKWKFYFFHRNNLLHPKHTYREDSQWKYGRIRYCYRRKLFEKKKKLSF